MPREENKKSFKPSKRLSWDEFFMRIAMTTSERTACIFHKIASVFVDEDHRIISIGYNGPSVGDYHCNEVGCAKVHGDPITGEIKRCRGAHSEVNAIINASDTSHYTPVGTITGITNPHELWMHPDGTRLYVSTYQANNVYVINTTDDNNTVMATLPCSRPYFISLDPDGTRLFVANYNANNIRVYDTTTLNPIATINTTAGPLSPIISPDGTRLYYVTDSDNKLTIAYSGNYSTIKTVQCGSGARGIACSPDGKKVYVTNMMDCTASIVNVEGDVGTILKTVRVGAYPYGMEQFAGYYQGD